MTKKVKIIPKSCTKSESVLQLFLVKLSLSEKPANVTGINIIACANIIGITPAAFTFKGMN